MTQCGVVCMWVTAAVHLVHKQVDSPGGFYFSNECIEMKLTLPSCCRRCYIIIFILGLTCDWVCVHCTRWHTLPRVLKLFCILWWFYITKVLNCTHNLMHLNIWFIRSSIWNANILILLLFSIISSLSNQGQVQTNIYVFNILNKFMLNW